MDYKELLKYTIYAFALLILQLLIFNYIHIASNINAFVYVLLIFLLPKKLSKSLVLIFAFFYGLIYDIFNNTVAINAASLTVIAFIRPFVLDVFQGRFSYNQDIKPSINSMRIVKYSTYCFVLLFVFHFVQNFFEIFSLKRILYIFGIAILNSLYSLVFVVALSMIFFKND